MKPNRCAVPILVILSVLARSQPSSAPVPEAIERTAHSTVWEWTGSATDELTGERREERHAVIELGDGLNWRDASGAWLPTRPEFAQVVGGFAVTAGNHKVFLPDGLGTDAVEVTLPDGQTLRSSPRLLTFFDRASGRKGSERGRFLGKGSPPWLATTKAGTTEPGARSCFAIACWWRWPAITVGGW